MSLQIVVCLSLALNAKDGSVVFSSLIRLRLVVQMSTNVFVCNMQYDTRIMTLLRCCFACLHVSYYP